MYKQPDLSALYFQDTKYRRRTCNMAGNAICFLVLIYRIIQVSCNKGETFIVSTPSGKLQGLIEIVDDKEIMKFRNIPYAKPPVGPLRFMNPIPYGPWEGVRDATKFGNICIQDLSQFEIFRRYEHKLPPKSEDCLSLNVYVPTHITTEKKRSVMIWLHGGGFTMGDGGSYDGTHLSLWGDVIVVTVNYRLGVLGFLGTGDSAAPGNYGIRDQIMAMQWVHDNIEAFGGNPESVTLFGESAGAYCVAIHSLIPSNKGLFQKAIIQSGSSASNVATSKTHLDLTLSCAITFGCVENTTSIDTLNTENLMTCLRKFPAEQIATMQLIAQGRLGFQFSAQYFPVVDGDLIKKTPLELLADKESEEYKFFRSIDTIIGTTSLEGALLTFIFGALQGPMQFNLEEGIPKEVACGLFLPAFTEAHFEDKRATEFICERWTNEDKRKIGQELMDFIGNTIFVAPAIRLLDYHTEGVNDIARSYHYLFSYEFHKGLLYKTPEWLKGRGSEHGSCVAGLFGPESIIDHLKGYIGDIRELKKTMIAYWSNFAKSSNPNSDGLVEWPEYIHGVGNYINLDKDEVVQGKKLFEEDITYILETLPRKLKSIKTEL